jgi:hypothetical protein
MEFIIQVEFEFGRLIAIKESSNEVKVRVSNEVDVWFQAKYL